MTLTYLTKFVCSLLTRETGTMSNCSLALCVCLSAGTAFAACPNVAGTGNPRWSFTDVQWTYSGSLSNSAVSGGAASWNSRQSFTNVHAATGYDDIHIVDDSSLTGLGEAQTYNYGNGGSACYLHKSYSCSSICYNTSRAYYADVRLSNNNIGGAASDWAPVWGITVSAATDLITTMVSAHEIGYFFGLLNWDGAQNCTDPTIMSVNDQFYCQLSRGRHSM